MEGEEDYRFHWDLCVLCQLATSEPVKQPAKSNNIKTVQSTYNEAARLLKSFSDINEIPDTFLPELSKFCSDENGFAKLMNENKATHSPDQLLLYLTSGPEVTNHVNFFQNLISPGGCGSVCHHEQTNAYQNMFVKHTRSLYNKEMFLLMIRAFCTTFRQMKFDLHPLSNQFSHWSRWEKVSTKNIPNWGW